jgi:hypothetical protein
MSVIDGGIRFDKPQRTSDRLADDADLFALP